MLRSELTGFDLSLVNVATVYDRRMTSGLYRYVFSERLSQSLFCQ